MKATTKRLILKELDEARWPLYAGAVVLVALPMLVTVDQIWRSNSDSMVMPWLSYVSQVFGAPLFVISALVIASRDFRDGEKAAWRGMPIRPLPFVLTKFLTGLIACIGILVVAEVLHVVLLALQQWAPRSNLLAYMIASIVQKLTSHIPLLGALYAIAFAIASASRHVMTALFLSVIASVLLYCLPVLVPALSDFNYFHLQQSDTLLYQLIPSSAGIASLQADPELLVIPMPDYQWLVVPGQLIVFLPAMLAIVIGCVTTSWLVVRRGIALSANGWHVAWVFVLVGLILFSLAAVQVGSNIDPVQVKPLTLGNNAMVSRATIHGEQGMAMLWDVSARGKASNFPFRVQRLDMSSSPPLEDASFQIDTTRGVWYGPYSPANMAWSPKQPAVVYVLHYGSDRPTLKLLTIDLNADEDHRLAHRIDLNLSNSEGTPKGTRRIVSRLYLMNGNLYVYPGSWHQSGPMLIRFDLGDPRAPKQSGEWPVRFSNAHAYLMTPRLPMNTYTFVVPLIEGLTWEQRFELAAQFTGDDSTIIATPQRTIAYTPRSGVCVYEAVQRTDVTVVYALRGRRQLTPLEQMTSYYGTDAALIDDRYYVLANNGLTVFDVRGAARPRKVGHYIAPNERLTSLAALDDGRVAVFGRSMHVLDLRGRGAR